MQNMRNADYGSLGGVPRDPGSVNLPAWILDAITFDTWETVIYQDQDRLFKGLYVEVAEQTFTKYWRRWTTTRDISNAPFIEDTSDRFNRIQSIREDAACVFQFACVLNATNAYFEHP